MLHTKFRKNILKVFFIIYGHDPDATNKLLSSPSPHPTHKKSTQKLALIGKEVSEMFEIVDDDAGAWVYYKLMSLWLR